MQSFIKPKRQIYCDICRSVALLFQYDNQEDIQWIAVKGWQLLRHGHAACNLHCCLQALAYGPTQWWNSGHANVTLNTATVIGDGSSETTSQLTPTDGYWWNLLPTSWGCIGRTVSSLHHLSDDAVQAHQPQQLQVTGPMQEPLLEQLNSSSASQETRRFIPPPVPILSQTSLVHAIPSCFFKTHFSIIHPTHLQVLELASFIHVPHQHPALFSSLPISDMTRHIISQQ
jgi:hypothetical protein